MEETRTRRWKELTETLLPERAVREDWPIRLHHCFKRISLDAAFGDVWHRHLARPAERHIDAEALERAITCAEQILIGGQSVLHAQNAASLRYRRKTGPHQRFYESRQHQSG